MAKSELNLVLKYRICIYTDIISTFSDPISVSLYKEYFKTLLFFIRTKLCRGYG